MNCVYKKYKIKSFMVPKEVVENTDGKTFYNEGKNIKLKEVVKKSTA